MAAIVSAVALVVALVLARRWLAVGFDPGSARSLGVRSPVTDALLLLTIALAVVSALAAVGTMLTSALYVLPPATTRLWLRDLRAWQLVTVALAAAEGVGGLWLAVEANVPPGAAIAVLAGWMGKVVSRAGGDPDVVVLGDGIPVKRKDDPHWWHDPRNAEAAVRRIAATLERVESKHRGAYARNAARYFATLRALDRSIAACVAQVPAAQRKLVTSHDAFGYFASRYGIRIVGAAIPSQTTQAHPRPVTSRT